MSSACFSALPAGPRHDSFRGAGQGLPRHEFLFAGSAGPGPRHDFYFAGPAGAGRGMIFLSLGWPGQGRGMIFICPRPNKIIPPPNKDSMWPEAPDNPAAVPPSIRKKNNLAAISRSKYRSNNRVYKGVRSRATSHKKCQVL